jgi:aminoglycoside/choline kinase family phosphotransferase
MSDVGTDDRRHAIAAFLNKAGWADVPVRLLAGDASFRKYYRLSAGARRSVLMDAPPPKEDVRPFVAIATHLAKMGFSAPRILASDVKAGLLLIEDFGDDTYTRKLAAGADETALYALAIDTLVALHRHDEASTVSVPPYDDERLIIEATLLTDWFLPAIQGRELPADIREDYVARWRGVFAPVRAVPTTLVLRDYHVDNLMLLPGRSGVAACGLLDFQDALIGPTAYDLVSLLEDARRDIAPALASAMFDRYAAAFPGLDRDALKAAYAVLGAQRNAKIIGIFTRLLRRDGKPQYLKHIPRVWRLLEGDLAHPALAPVREWFDKHVPKSQRIAPGVTA